jgi:hypothetical protein
VPVAEREMANRWRNPRLKSSCQVQDDPLTLVRFERVLPSMYHLITKQAAHVYQLGNRFELAKTIAQLVNPSLQTINPFANRFENGSEAILRLRRPKHR